MYTNAKQVYAAQLAEIDARLALHPAQLLLNLLAAMRREGRPQPLASP